MKKTAKNIAFFVSLAAAVVLASYSSIAKPGLEQVPEDALIVDVRTPAEFGAAHFPGAVNIPLSDLQVRLGELGSADRKIVVYCRSGRRSGIAKDFLDRAGYKNVSNGGALQQMMSLVPKQ